MLTRETLTGVFCFIPTPWDENFKLDEKALRHDLCYLCNTGIKGLYTTDTSGEFYAMELDEFCQFIDIVIDLVKPEGVSLQVGCTWTDTNGALRRAKYAAEKGADAIKFSFPYWEKLTVDECFRFIEELADTCGNTPLIHYNNVNSKVLFGVEEYNYLVKYVPTLIGTKLTSHDPITICEIIEKITELNHFVTEYVFTPSMGAGAKGMYSWIAATNPRLALEWYAVCLEGDWDRAMEIQTMVNRWKVHVKNHWGYTSSAAINKLDALVNPNFTFNPRVRPPYTSGRIEDIEYARRWAKRHIPQLLML